MNANKRMSTLRLAEAIFAWEVLDNPDDPAWHGLTATQRERWIRRAQSAREMYPEVVGVLERADRAEAALARVKALILESETPRAISSFGVGYEVAMNHVAQAIDGLDAS